MKHILLLCLGVLVAAKAACAGEALPPDVRAFLDKAETCEHLAGEFDGSLPAGQRREIHRNIRTSCGGAHRQLPRLQKKYRHDERVLKLLSGHEAVESYTPH